jgi:hypothetical protein
MFKSLNNFPGYRNNIPYEFANNTNDPEGKGKTLSTITSAHDLGKIQISRPRTLNPKALNP